MTSIKFSCLIVFLMTLRGTIVKLSGARLGQASVYCVVILSPVCACQVVRAVLPYTCYTDFQPTGDGVGVSDYFIVHCPNGVNCELDKMNNSYDPAHSHQGDFR